MKRVLILAVLLAVAGGYWFYQSRDHVPPQPEPREVAPQRWQVASTQPGTEGNLTVPEDLNATNDTADMDQNASLLDNATLALIPRDEIVRHEFVDDTATYFVDLYLPSGTQNNPTGPSRLDLNVKALNMRYGVDFFGLAVDPVETLQSRKLIFAHVLQGPVLDFLHAAYMPLFLNSLDQSLQSAAFTLPDGRTVPITPAQRREMMTMLAKKLRAVGQIVAILARTDSMRPLVTKYLEEMDKVTEAHLAFWNLQTEEASPAALSEGSARIKTAIQSREMSRQRLLQTIATLADPQGLDASELIYLAQWVYRRGQENDKTLEIVGKAGDLLVRTAVALEERSQQAPGVPDAAPAQTVPPE